MEGACLLVKNFPQILQISSLFVSTACSQEREHHAVYCDAYIVKIKRMPHDNDSKGCRCIFVVRYDHDHTEVIYGKLDCLNFSPSLTYVCACV